MVKEITKNESLESDDFNELASPFLGLEDDVDDDEDLDVDDDLEVDEGPITVADALIASFSEPFQQYF